MSEIKKHRNSAIINGFFIGVGGMCIVMAIVIWELVIASRKSVEEIYHVILHPIPEEVYIVFIVLIALGILLIAFNVTSELLSRAKLTPPPPPPP